MDMPRNSLKLPVLMVFGATLLAACQPAHTRGTYDNGIYQEPVSAQSRVYRTADGRVFRTRAERDAYLRAVERQREREIYEADLRRDQRLQRRTDVLAAERAAERRARQNARLERERRRQTQAERELQQAERARRRAERAARQAERTRQGQTRIGRDPDLVEREARQREREARRAARRAQRQQDELVRSQRVARQQDVLRRQRARAAPLNGAVLDQRTDYERHWRVGESRSEFERRLASAKAKADRDGGSVTDYLNQSQQNNEK
ncbi:MAG: hypothetical protein AB8B85_01020 [Paracoccaceae bacterium]